MAQHPSGFRDKYALDQCLVAVKGADGAWYLATRTVFEGREAAEAYARTCGRETLIVTAVRPIVWEIRS